MIKVNRDTQIKTIQTPGFILSGRDRDVQNLILLRVATACIQDYGHTGIRFTEMDKEVILPLLVQEVNRLMLMLETNLYPREDDRS